MKCFVLLLAIISVALALEREPKILVYELSEQDGEVPQVKLLNLPRNQKSGYNANNNQFKPNRVKRTKNRNDDNLNSLLQQLLASDSVNENEPKPLRLDESKYLNEAESVLSQLLKPAKPNKRAERQGIIKNLKNLVKQLQRLDKDEEVEATNDQLRALNGLFDNNVLGPKANSPVDVDQSKSWQQLDKKLLASLGGPDNGADVLDTLLDERIQPASKDSKDNFFVKAFNV